MRKKVIELLLLTLFNSLAVSTVASNSDNQYFLSAQSGDGYVCSEIVRGENEYSGSNYTPNFTTNFCSLAFNKSFYEENGSTAFRIGSSKDLGGITATLSKNTDHVIVYAKSYGKDSGSSLKINNNSFALTSNYEKYELWLEEKSNVITFENSAKGKRISIFKIVFRLYN